MSVKINSKIEFSNQWKKITHSPKNGDFAKRPEMGRSATSWLRLYPLRQMSNSSNFYVRESSRSHTQFWIDHLLLLSKIHQKRENYYINGNMPQWQQSSRKQIKGAKQLQTSEYNIQNYRINNQRQNNGAHGKQKLFQ